VRHWYKYLFCSVGSEKFFKEIAFRVYFVPTVLHFLVNRVDSMDTAAEEEWNGGGSPQMVYYRFPLVDPIIFQKLPLPAGVASGT